METAYPAPAIILLSPVELAEVERVISESV
jgi:hypothetical protein